MMHRMGLITGARRHYSFAPLSVSPSGEAVGSCAEFSFSKLGSNNRSSRDGLVAKNLQYEAQHHLFGTDYFTLERPYVKINDATLTCRSISHIKGMFTSVAVVVHYSCIGIACRQKKGKVREQNYSHHFSFVCDEASGDYAIQNVLFGTRPYIRRQLSSSKKPLPREYCTFCSINPSEELYNSTYLAKHFNKRTGCVST